MDISANVSHIRRIYSRPRQQCAATDPGKVSTCIHVGMLPETTLFAHKTMFEPFAKFPTAGTCLAGISWIDVLNSSARDLCFVLDKGLQLPPSPAMQSDAYPLPRLNAGANMRQVFHRDFADPRFDSRLDNSLTRFVIDLLHASHLFAGDLPSFCQALWLPLD